MLKLRLLLLLLLHLLLLKEACGLLLEWLRLLCLLLLVGICGETEAKGGVLLESGRLGLEGSIVDLGSHGGLRMYRHGGLVLLNGLEEVNEIRFRTLIGFRLGLGNGLGGLRIGEAIARRERVVTGGHGRAGGCLWEFKCVALELLCSSAFANAFTLGRLLRNVLPPVNLEVGVLQVVLKLASKMDGRVLKSRHRYPRVVLVLACYAEVCHDVLGLSRKRPVDLHSSLGVSLGHLEEVPYDLCVSLSPQWARLPRRETSV